MRSSPLETSRTSWLAMRTLRARDVSAVAPTAAGPKKNGAVSVTSKAESSFCLEVDVADTRLKDPRS